MRSICDHLKLSALFYSPPPGGGESNRGLTKQGELSKMKFTADKKHRGAGSCFRLRCRDELAVSGPFHLIRVMPA